MNISELNHLENVNESSLVNGGYVDVYTYGSAFASGILANASSSSFSDVYKSYGYDYWYGGYYESESGYAGSSGSASALSGVASTSTTAGGYASSGYYYYY